MIKVLVAALLGTVVGIVVMVVVIVAAGSSTSNASSIGLNPSVSTAALSTAGSTPTSTPSSGGGSTGGGNAAAIAAGKQVFSSNGCGSCHTLTVAGATGTLGPDLGKAVAADAQKDNMPVADFIKQSITDPAAYTAQGGPWATPMPTSFGSSLSATQINDLVALILSGQGK